MVYALISDIHANYGALEETLQFINKKYGEIPIICLGDYIDYGPRPNETIKLLSMQNIQGIVLGNHEYSILYNDFTKYSSERAKKSIIHTKNLLDSFSLNFIKENSETRKSFDVSGKKILIIHGDLTDNLWGSMNSLEKEKTIYSEYDFVISGHTHIPHFSEVYFKSENDKYRNLKKTIFINPGSVGQPRNHNKFAQFCIVNFKTEVIYFEKTNYNIQNEMKHYQDGVDEFYKNRIKIGI